MYRTPLLQSLFIAGLACTFLPAQSADAEATTDRVVVKYRAGDDLRLNARTLSHATMAAMRFRMSVKPVAIKSGGSVVLRLDRCVPVKYALALASEIEAADDQVEHAWADVGDEIAIAPGIETDCPSERSAVHAAVP